MHCHMFYHILHHYSDTVCLVPGPVRRQAVVRDSVHVQSRGDGRPAVSAVRAQRQRLLLRAHAARAHAAGK